MGTTAVTDRTPVFLAATTVEACLSRKHEPRGCCRLLRRPCQSPLDLCESRRGALAFYDETMTDKPPCTKVYSSYVFGIRPHTTVQWKAIHNRAEIAVSKRS